MRFYKKYKMCTTKFYEPDKNFEYEFLKVMNQSLMSTNIGILNLFNKYFR